MCFTGTFKKILVISLIIFNRFEHSIIIVGFQTSKNCRCAIGILYSFIAYPSNAIMVDGTGMCGACRVTVGGQTRFVCVDGPEFDGHKVNFEELSQRLMVYKKYEEISYKKMKEEGCELCRTKS